MSRGWRVVLALLAGPAAALLVGCESMPAPGAQVRAEIVAVPRDRAQLQGGFTQLHPALRAGVQRADAEAGRLWLAQCVEPDTDAPGGLRPRTATLLLPPGTAPQMGALVGIDRLQAAHATDPRRHGHFAGWLARSLPSAAGAPGGHVVFGKWRPTCRPDGAAQGLWHVQLSGAVAPWEIDFARAELARHDSLSDSELAAGRVVVVSCQLKVMDGSDWNRPSWIARLPGGQQARVGERVELRTGAEEGGRATAPLAQVLGPAADAPRPPAPGVVRCH